MALTPDQAAEVAARHGLTLGDAAALRALTDSADEADKIARRFAASTTSTDAAKRAFLADLDDRQPDANTETLATLLNTAAQEDRQ